MGRFIDKLYCVFGPLTPTIFEFNPVYKRVFVFDHVYLTCILQ